MRALEIGLRMKTIFLKGRSFSVDVKKDFIKAKKVYEKDSVFRLYKNSFNEPNKRKNHLKF